MEQKVADNESVARILNNAWFEDAGIFTRFQNMNVKPGKMIKTGKASEEVSADTLLLEVRSCLLSISTIETCKYRFE
jgi:hypothetical protein